jgi:parallel beta-helix repeat protein
VASNVLYVDPTANTNGNGSITRPFNTWTGISFKPGTNYLQMAGTTWHGTLTVGKSATGAAPIAIGSYGTGAPPAIVGSVNFDSASNVSLTGFNLTAGQQAAAVLIQQGSNNIQISSNTVSASEIGVWIGNGAGGGDTISGNSISGSSLFGIDVGGIVNAAGQQTVISQNTVSLSGSDGLELQGSNFVVQNNMFTQNGQTVAGSSGIHVYSPSAGSGFGANNAITGNTVIGTHIVNSVDGNGIELDVYTSHNTVSGNTVCGNDGSGITLFDSWSNTISGNMVFCNDAGPISPGNAHAELVLVSTQGMTTNNTISGNTFEGISPSTPVVQVDNVSSASHNLFTANLLEDFGAAAMYDWAGTSGGNANWWRGVTGGSDVLAGTLPTSSGSPSGGTSYAFDSTFAVSPFGASFHFPWQTGPAYSIPSPAGTPG